MALGTMVILGNDPHSGPRTSPSPLRGAAAQEGTPWMLGLVAG